MEMSKPTRVAKKMPPRDLSVMPCESSKTGQSLRLLLLQ